MSRSTTSALSLALLAATQALAAGPTPICDETTPLSVLGMDTRSGAVVFSVAGADGAVDLIELAPEASEARSFGQPAGSRHFAGSVGPGPVFALARCGEGCALAERFEAGAWRALGEPLAVPPNATFALTYARDGRPWVMAHRPAGSPPWVEARAYRFAAEAWQERGRLAVRSLGSPAAGPAPWLLDGVVSGTGLFRAGSEPATWVEGLPALPPEQEGQVVALAASAAAYVAADGALYLSADGGATWSGTRWRPWGIGSGQLWSAGSDYDLDLPLAALEEPLPVVWFDRRPGRPAALSLTEVSARGAWTMQARLAPAIEVETVGSSELVHLLRTDGGTWVLATDCFLARGMPALALQTVTPAGTAAARSVAVRGGD